MKSIFNSTTFWGSIAALITTITPVIGSVIIDGNTFTSRHLEIIVTASVTTIITIIGRINAKDTVYTPKGLIGPNKEGPINNIIIEDTPMSNIPIEDIPIEDISIDEDLTP